MSRRRKRVSIVVFVCVIAVAMFCDRYFLQDFRLDLTTVVPVGADAEKYHNKTFTVVKSVDGDTIDIGIADGKYNNTRLRLLGVDTPETKDPRQGQMYFGQQASDYTARLTLNKQVTILIDTVSDVRDKYGRLLCYVQLNDGAILNEKIIESGHGYADLRFTHSKFDKYVQTQENAIKSGVGLWKTVKRDQLPGWLKREKPLLLR